MQKRNKVLIILSLQGALVIYALSTVTGKFASNYEFLSSKYLVLLFIELALLGLYSILWQQIIKNIDISIAYSNKATCIIWGLIFGVLIFKEKVTLLKIVGVIVIITGILMVNKND